MDIAFDTSTDFELDVGALVFGDAPLLIGAGNFASIHKALYRGEAVAVKVQPYLLVDAAVGAADLPDMDSEEASQLRELAILRSLRHDNLVRFVGAARVPASTLPARVWSATTNTRGAVANDGMEPTQGVLLAAQDALLIVTEWMEGGDLLQLLRSDDSDRPLGWLQRVRLLRGVAAGLAFLHARGVIHRDIKTANMLVDADFGACKLCDHGLARPGATQERRERLIAALTPKPQRVVELLTAFIDLLVSPVASSREMAAYVGIINWHNLMNRPLYSCLDAVYTFARSEPQHTARLVGSDVLTELMHNLSLAAFWIIDLCRPWMPCVPATDASGSHGFGFCLAKFSPDAVRAAATHAFGVHHFRLRRTADDPAELHRQGPEKRLELFLSKPT